MDQASNTCGANGPIGPQNRLIVFLRIEQAFRCLITESPAAFEHNSTSSSIPGSIDPGGESAFPVESAIAWANPMMKGIIAYKQQDLLQAAWEIRRGYRTIQEGLAHFPKFLPSRRDMAILQLLIGTVPDRYQWAVELLSGIRGTPRTGQTVLSGSVPTSVPRDISDGETVFLEAILLHYVLSVRTSGSPRAQQIPPGT